MVVMITPVAFANIGYKTYVVFAAINALMVPCVYFFFPETAGRSLEEMDEIFHQLRGLGGALAVVRVAETVPRRYGKRGEVLIQYENTVGARRSEVVAGGKDVGIGRRDERREDVGGKVG